MHMVAHMAIKFHHSCSLRFFFFFSCRCASAQHGETKRNNKQSAITGRCKEILNLRFMPLMLNIAHVTDRRISEDPSHLFQ